MNKLLSLTAVGFLLCVSATGCGTTGPDNQRGRVVVTGTVRLNDEPAGGLVVALSFLRPGCALFCDPVLEEITTATTAADGTYRIEVEEPNSGWSCDTTLFVRVTGYLFPSHEVRGCLTHRDVDLWLTG